MVGILVFYGENRKVLLKAICQNLEKSKERYLNSENHRELQQKIVQVEQKPFPTLLEALVHFKSLPEGEVKQFAQYRYLCLDCEGVPCLSSASDTLAASKDFVGPFRNLFFISDFTDKFAQRYDLPALSQERMCENILDFYLDEKVWQECKNELDDLENRLDFAKAEILAQDLQPLRRYFEYLQFIRTSKNLCFSCSWQGADLQVKDGLLQKFGDLRFRLDYRPMEYQKSEQNALPLDELDEREIVYRFWQELGEQSAHLRS